MDDPNIKNTWIYRIIINQNSAVEYKHANMLYLLQASTRSDIKMLIEKVNKPTDNWPQ